MIVEKKFFCVQCDRSKKYLGQDTGEIYFYHDKDKLAEVAQEEGWREIEGKWYSPEFIGYDADKDEYFLTP